MKRRRKLESSSGNTRPSWGSKRLQEFTSDEAEARGKIGVLSFASAKGPGGGFLNGSQAQVCLSICDASFSSL